MHNKHTANLSNPGIGMEEDKVRHDGKGDRIDREIDTGRVKWSSDEPYKTVK